MKQIATVRIEEVRARDFHILVDEGEDLNKLGAKIQNILEMTGAHFYFKTLKETATVEYVELASEFPYLKGLLDGVHKIVQNDTGEYLLSQVVSSHEFYDDGEDK